MTTKILMSQLWPNAGGRTRAVFNRNELIRRAIDDDVELVVLERADDLQERIAASERRFGSRFRVEALYQRIRYERAVGGRFKTVEEVIYAHLGSMHGLSFIQSDEGRMMTVHGADKSKLTFWSRNGFANFLEGSSPSDRLACLASEAKVTIGYFGDVRVFRMVSDTYGKLMSLGQYDALGKRYVSEQYYNIFGEIILEFFDSGIGRIHRVHFGSQATFVGNDAAVRQHRYLIDVFVTLQSDDVLFVDEPKLYRLGLELGTNSTIRILYFHWYNLGPDEIYALQDESVRKTAVFLTQGQRDDFIEKSGAGSNLQLDSIVIDNVLDEAGGPLDRTDGANLRIVSVGRLAPEKNVERTVRAFARFLDYAPGSVLTLVGDGPARSALEDLCVSLGIRESVVFSGNLADPYCSEYFKSVDLALQTPRNEAYGLVFPELISRGIPVVTVDSPYGPRRWIQEDLNGTLLDFDASDELIARAMLDVVELELSPRAVMATLDIGAINESVESKLHNLVCN